jgi:hypothetical protein
MQMRDNVICVWALALFACAPVGHHSSTDAAPKIDASSSSGDANGCTMQPCDILPQCGCNTGYACDIDTLDNMGTGCREVTGMGHESTACTSLEQCDKGWGCIENVGGGAACREYCTTNTDCGPPRGQCVIDLGVSGAPPVCSSNCDPLAATNALCPSGTKCLLLNTVYQSVTYPIVDCGAAGTGMNGANCKQNNMANEALCAGPFTCVTFNNGNTYTCQRICNKNNPGGTCGGQTCLSFSPPFVVAGIEYGVCG